MTTFPPRHVGDAGLGVTKSGLEARLPCPAPWVRWVWCGALSGGAG